MSATGWVLECWDQTITAYAAADVTAGETVVPIVGAHLFADTGGYAFINGATYAYSSVDYEEGLMVLATPLLTGVFTDDGVELRDSLAGGPKVEVRARVELVDGYSALASNAVNVLVVHSLADRLPRGGRGGQRGELVALEDYNLTYRVSDVLGEPLVTDGQYLGDETVPLVAVLGAADEGDLGTLGERVDMLEDRLSGVTKTHPGPWPSTAPAMGDGFAEALTVGMLRAQVTCTAVTTSTGNAEVKVYFDTALVATVGITGGPASVRVTLPPAVFSVDIADGTHRVYVRQSVGTSAAADTCVVYGVILPT